MSAAKHPASADLLVEIGCEELPPKALASLASEFKERLRSGLQSRFFIQASNQSATAYFGPRRFAVLVKDVLEQSMARGEVVTGPSIGAPEKAIEGFARKVGATIDKLGQRDGKYVFERQVAGSHIRDAAGGIVTAALDGIPIPKRMRWGAGDAEFVRPVQWVVLLHGDKPIEADIYGVKSGTATRGHRIHHPQPIALKSAAEYATTLKAAKVLLNDAARTVEAEIRRQAEAKAAAAGGTLLAHAVADGGLISEVAALCEWPVVLEGRFDPRFLALPRAVLVAAIETNQRYFLLEGADGKLLPKFLFVANLESKRPATVVAGNERVIVPRLSDAMFFWEQDRRTPLELRAAGLDGVLFQKELGSYAKKAAAVGTLAEQLAPKVGADAATVRRAAALAKCDLLTNLVGEFPELQGTVGRALAAADGEPAEVAAAIEEQYLPRYAGDALPTTKAGQALALAEKLDTVCSIFAIGQKPTGDKDPFALRRAALGAMRIAIELKLGVDLEDAVGRAYRRHRPDATASDVAAVFAFFSERMRAYYADRGIRADVFEAIEHDAFRDPPHADGRLKAVQEFLKLPEAASLAAANKRIANILEQAAAKGLAPAAKVDGALLEAGPERALHELLHSGEVEWIRGLIDQHAYDSALKKLAAFKAPVDAYFDGVMVMAEDAKVRANRLALLAEVRALFTRIADVGRLQLEA